MGRFASNIAAVLVVALIALAPRDVRADLDQSDLWWNPGESGWGIQFIQHVPWLTPSTIFATMFVYDTAGQPTWYTATMPSHYIAPAGPDMWTGDLYATTGPWFGASAFDPNVVTRRKVGTMTWTVPKVTEYPPATQGTLTYDVDGVAKTKQLIRQTFGIEDYSGLYTGVLVEDVTGCSSAASNGRFINYGTFRIVQTGAQSGAQLTMTTTVQSGVSCVATTNLMQTGPYGYGTGIYSCSTSDVGTIALYDLRWQPAERLPFIRGRYHSALTNGRSCVTNAVFTGIALIKGPTQ